MTSLTFTVLGTPAPQGSHVARIGKGGRAHIVDSNVNLEPWRDRVMLTAHRSLPPGWVPFAGPVAVTLVFHLPRPQSAPKTRDIFPTSRKADLDKLVRAIHDACTDAGVWVDDSLVVSLRADKFYAVGPSLPRIYDPEFHTATPQVAVHIHSLEDH